MKHEVRRRADGSIDIEFYRDAGLAERRAMIKHVFNGLFSAAWARRRTGSVATVAGRKAASM